MCFFLFVLQIKCDNGAVNEAQAVAPTTEGTSTSTTEPPEMNQREDRLFHA